MSSDADRLSLPCPSPWLPSSGCPGRRSIGQTRASRATVLGGIILGVINVGSLFFLLGL